MQPLWKTLWGVLEKLKIGNPGWYRGLHLPLAHVAILETRDRIPCRIHSARSLLLPLPVSLRLSLCDYHKKIFKKKLKIELPYDSKIAELGIYPKDTKVV